MPIVIVATENPLKQKSVLQAFLEYYDEAVFIDSMKASSDVPKQPFNEDVFDGAVNRIKNLKWRCELTKRDYDFLVAVEAGIIQFGPCWYNVQFVMIESKTGRRATGMSQGFQIPKEYIEFIKENSINAMFRSLFDNHPDGLKVITQGIVSRGDLIRDGTIMALAGFTDENKW